MIKFLIKYHIVKNERQAQILLLVLTVLIISASIYFLAKASADPVVRTISSF